MSDEQAHQIDMLRQEVRDLTTQVHDLVDAWNTARGVVKFVKWMGSLATAIAAILALVKLGAQK